MKKEIRIFLASSITEFAIERDKLELFIRNISDDFEDTYNIKIRPYRCENIDPAMSKTRKQDVYNELIKGSEMCFFIFFTKIGEFTKEEFEVAYEAFKGNGKPKIYIYFKNIPEGVTVEQEVIDFMNKIDNEFSHYHGTFDDIDTIKLRILLNLKIQEMDFLPIEISEGRCFVNGKEVRGIQIDNVSEFANNNYLNKMKDDLSSIEKQYNVMFSDYSSGRDDEDFLKQYSEVVTKRKNLITDIEELQKNIFNLSLRMCQDEVYGEITIRQKEAYRLFEQGKYKEANDILDFDEIKSEYQRKKTMRIAEQKREARIFIREIKQKIDILETLSFMNGIFPTEFNDETEKYYETIVPEVIENLVETEIILEYAKFLELQKDYNRAKNFYLKAIEIYENLIKNEPEKYNEMLFDAYTSLGGFYRFERPQLSEDYFLKAVTIGENLFELNAEEYGRKLIEFYDDLGCFYNLNGEIKKAEKAYLKKIKMLMILIQKHPSRFESTMARTYDDIGEFYIHCGQLEKAEKYRLMSLEIYESLAKKDPGYYRRFLVDVYLGLCKLYHALGNLDKFEKYCVMSIVTSEALFNEDPMRYYWVLTGNYRELGDFYCKSNELEKAEEFYLKSIDVYKNMKYEKSEKIQNYLVDDYLKLARFYGKYCKEFSAAEECYLKAKSLCEELLKNNRSKRNNRSAIEMYKSIICFYWTYEKLDLEKEFRLNLLTLCENLFVENPKEYGDYLAESCFDLGCFYEREKEFENSEKFYLKTVEIVERLLNEFPKKYHYDEFVYSYLRLSTFYKEQGQKEKALFYKQKADGVEFK